MATWLTTVGVALNQQEASLGLEFGPAIPNSSVSTPPEAFKVIAARAYEIARANGTATAWRALSTDLRVGVPSSFDLKGAILADAGEAALTLQLVSGVKPELEGPLHLDDALVLHYDGSAIPGGDSGIKVLAS